MLSTTELFELTEHPKINQISYKLLAEYYEKYLLNNKFIYDLQYEEYGQTKKKTICIIPEKRNFCHLLGIEKIASPIVNKKNLFNYRSETGFDNVKKGLITIENFKKLNKKGFNNCKDKAIFFYLIPKILYNPVIIKFDNKKVIPSTSISCEFVFYEKILNAYVHIGMDCDENTYFPKSLFIEKIKESNPGTKFINKQTEITVTKIQIK